jgi:carbon starvation protein
VTTWLVNTGRGRYAWVTVPPMLFVIATTMSAGTIMTVTKQLSPLNLSLVLFVIISVFTVVVMALARWIGLTAAPIRSRQEVLDYGDRGGSAPQPGS